MNESAFARTPHANLHVCDAINSSKVAKLARKPSNKNELTSDGQSRQNRLITMSVLSRFVAFTNRHPVVRGMISYATIWPTSCIIQQTMAGKNFENYDWMQALRFSLYGGLFTAPTLYAWVRLSTIIWPKTNLKTAVTKAVVEQMSYGPAAMACFFFGMSLMEGKSVQEAKHQVELKFWPSYKVAICFWPFLQTINFCFVPEKNRVPYVSVCSLVWCCFLAYMHQLQIKKQAEVSILNEQLLQN